MFILLTPYLYNLSNGFQWVTQSHHLDHPGWNSGLSMWNFLLVFFPFRTPTSLFHFRSFRRIPSNTSGSVRFYLRSSLSGLPLLLSDSRLGRTKAGNRPTSAIPLFSTPLSLTCLLETSPLHRCALFTRTWGVTVGVPVSQKNRIR